MGPAFFVTPLHDSVMRVKVSLAGRQQHVPARNGKPVERPGRKASGLRTHVYGSGVTERNKAIPGAPASVKSPRGIAQVAVLRRSIGGSSSAAQGHPAMNLTKVVLAGAILGAALVASFSVVAGRSTQSFGIRLVVEDACHVDTARFVAQDHAGTTVAATTTTGVAVDCKAATPHRVDIAIGPVPMPSVDPPSEDATTLVISY